jgi:hypothetical protein
MPLQAGLARPHQPINLPAEQQDCFLGNLSTFGETEAFGF